ncbi:hypothetical protein ACWD3Z_12030 [Streptomyces sp. NPDC002740]
MEPSWKLTALAVAAGSLLTACSADDSLDYQSDYAGHAPLHVVGYPSRGSLDVVQNAVWRLADGDAGALAGLAVDDRSADATARNWVDAYGTDAQGQVTADFYDEGSTRQVVVLYFASGQVKEIEARIGEDDAWGLTMDEPKSSEARAKPTWAPAQPGGSGSRSSGN